MKTSSMPYRVLISFGFAGLLISASSAASLVGLWEFDDSSNLGKATVGQDLVVRGTPPSYSASVSDSNSKALNGVVLTTFGVGNDFKVTNPIGPNGSGTLKTNQFSLVFDFMSPSSSNGRWRTFYQTDLTNGNDGEFFLNKSDNTLGTAQLTYSSRAIQPDTWGRLVVTFDVGNAITAYLDGAHFYDYYTEAGDIDDRYALQNIFYLFADNDGDNAPLYAGMVAFFDGVLSPAEVRLMGKAGSPIPEPATAVLLLAAGAFGLRRRR